MTEHSENLVFFKQWYKNPFTLGTFLPISKGFATTAAKIIKPHATNGRIIELGAGTGRLTQALVDEGIKQIVPLELENNLAQFLKNRFDGNDAIEQVIEGDATKLTDYISEASLIISVLPLMYMPKEKRFEIINEAFKLKPKTFIHVCYTPFSPLGDQKDAPKQYKVTRLKNYFKQIPFGFIWRFDETN